MRAGQPKKRSVTLSRQLALSTRGLLACLAMDWSAIRLDELDWQALWEQTRDVLLPHLWASVLTIVLAAVFYVAARWLLRLAAKHLTARTETRIDDAIVAATRQAISVSVVFWALWRLAAVWNLPAVGRATAAVWLVALAFPLGGLLADLLKTAEEKLAPKTETTLDDTALPLLNKVLRFGVVAVAVILALDQLGVNITPLVAGASVAGLAVSLAAKDTLSNLIAGVLLIMDRPFQIGDRIEVWNAPRETSTWGDVIEIGLRATKIRSTDNLVYVIPNNQIMQRDIINYTSSGEDIRVRIPIEIAYDADAEAAKTIIKEIVEDVPGIKETPPPQVIIRRFGESGVTLQIRVWIADARRRRAIADEITDRVKIEFDKQGVEIPYPKRDLYIKSMPEDLMVVPSQQQPERGNLDE
jgi:small-conductance mechanosensitive channel